MRRRWLLNLGLAIAVGLLALLAWQRPGTDGEATEPPLTNLEAADINSVVIKRGADETLAMERRGGKWWLIRPIEARAPGYRVSSVLDLAGTPSYARIDVALAQDQGQEHSEDRTQGQGESKDKSPADFGITAASASITLNDREIRFGATNPVGLRRYVAVGDTIQLIEDRFHHHAQGDWSNWVDRRLLPEGAALESIKMPDFALERTDGKWILTPDTGADADTIARYIDGWRLAHAMQVTKAAPPMAERSPRIEIRWRPDAASDAEKLLSLELLHEGDEVILRSADPPLHYRFPADSAANLLMPPLPPAEPPTASAEGGGDGVAEPAPP